MPLKIRLSRGGAKKRPYYRIVIADSRAPRDGRFIERVGSYNPLLPKESDERITLKEDRIKHWLSVGARPTDRVNRFLDEAGIMKREPRNNPKKALPGKKRLEREEAEREAADLLAARIMLDHENALLEHDPELAVGEALRFYSVRVRVAPEYWDDPPEEPRLLEEVQLGEGGRILP